MRYEFFIGQRYLFSPRQDRSISVITWISICGVALGVIALIVVTSVMNGFRDNLRQAITGALPHITLFSASDQMDHYADLEQQIRQHPEVIEVTPYITKQAMLTGAGKPKGTLLRGIDPQQDPKVTRIVSFLRKNPYSLITSSAEEQKQIAKTILTRLSHRRSRRLQLKDGIILGSTLAQQMNVKIGDRIQLISSEQRMTPIGDVPYIKQLEVVGFFASGLSGYDEVLAFIDYRLLQKVYRMQSQITGLGVRINDPELAPQVSDELQQWAANYTISNWAGENKSLFQVMKLEKLGLFVILTLIIVVAACNIIGSLVMLVVEKSREIAILKSLGATDFSVRKIFMLQGIVIGILGTGAGVSLGLLICWILLNFDFLEIPAGTYPGGNQIPLLIHWGDVGATSLASFFICFLVTLYPSFKAARLNPVNPLRYE